MTAEDFDKNYVRDISEIVYRSRLGPGGAERMVTDDGDDGSKLRGRAGAYDGLTRDYLRALRKSNG